VTPQIFKPSQDTVE